MYYTVTHKELSSILDQRYYHKKSYIFESQAIHKVLFMVKKQKCK